MNGLKNIIFVEIYSILEMYIFFFAKIDSSCHFTQESIDDNGKKSYWNTINVFIEKDAA